MKPERTRVEKRGPREEEHGRGAQGGQRSGRAARRKEGHEGWRQRTGEPRASGGVGLNGAGDRAPLPTAPQTPTAGGRARKRRSRRKPGGGTVREPGPWLLCRAHLHSPCAHMCSMLYNRCRNACVAAVRTGAPGRPRSRQRRRLCGPRSPAPFTPGRGTASKARRRDARGSRTQSHAQASPTSFPASTGWLHSR